MSDLRSLPIVGAGITDKIERAIAVDETITPEQAKRAADAVTYLLRRGGVIAYVADLDLPKISDDQWGVR